MYFDHAHPLISCSHPTTIPLDYFFPANSLSLFMSCVFVCVCEIYSVHYFTSMLVGLFARASEVLFPLGPQLEVGPHKPFPHSC